MSIDIKFRRLGHFQLTPSISSHNNLTTNRLVSLNPNAMSSISSSSSDASLPTNRKIPYWQNQMTRTARVDIFRKRPPTHTAAGWAACTTILRQWALQLLFACIVGVDERDVNLKWHRRWTAKSYRTCRAGAFDDRDRTGTASRSSLNIWDW
jgi:hypothetical protein